MRRRRGNGPSLKVNKLLVLALIVFMFAMSVAYAAFNDKLTLVGTVEVPQAENKVVEDDDDIVDDGVTKYALEATLKARMNSVIDEGNGTYRVYYNLSIKNNNDFTINNWYVVIKIPGIVSASPYNLNVHDADLEKESVTMDSGTQSWISVITSGATKTFGVEFVISNNELPSPVVRAYSNIDTFVLEDYEYDYDDMHFDVDYTVDDNFYGFGTVATTAEVTITNNGSREIKNLKFDMIYNKELTDTRYVGTEGAMTSSLSNANKISMEFQSWTMGIPAGESITFKVKNLGTGLNQFRGLVFDNFSYTKE